MEFTVLYAATMKGNMQLLRKSLNKQNKKALCLCMSVSVSNLDDPSVITTARFMGKYRPLPSFSFLSFFLSFPSRFYGKWLVRSLVRYAKRPVNLEGHMRAKYNLLNHMYVSDIWFTVHRTHNIVVFEADRKDDIKLTELSRRKITRERRSSCKLVNAASKDTYISFVLLSSKFMSVIFFA